MKRPAIVIDTNVLVSECAEAAEAYYLVTSNKRHFLERRKNGPIVNARELLDRLNLP